MEALTIETLSLSFSFDLVLGFTLLWLAWQALSSPELFRAIVLFIAFGLLMALAWARLEAIDVALAEAAIGAGLTGALLLAALARLNETKTSQGKMMTLKPEQEENKKTPLFRCLLMFILTSMAIGLSYAILLLPAEAPGLSLHVKESLELSGVSNPVTAVLLNFRGYDTLLEMGVLLLALLGVWSLGNIPEPNKSTQIYPGAILDMLPRLLVPVLIMVAGYLLWVGGHAPGGAFQAGAVLAAAGVLLLLAGWRLGANFVGLPLRITLVLGLTLFILIGIILVLMGNHFLEFPPPIAAALILLIEAAATLSIGMTLAALFFSNQAESKS